MTFVFPLMVVTSFTINFILNHLSMQDYYQRAILRRVSTETDLNLIWSQLTGLLN